VYQLGGERDCTKYQIYYATPPSIGDEIMLLCYHCNDFIVREDDEQYVIVAAAYQRPIYFHVATCYGDFLNGMIIFYNEVIHKDVEQT